MELDAPRLELLRLIKENETDLAYLSTEVLLKNHAYLQQYLRRGSPRVLPEDARERLGKHFGVHPSVFKPGLPMGSARHINLDRAEIDDLRWVTPVAEVDSYTGMGAGGVMDDNNIVGVWQLPGEWLRSEMRVTDTSGICILTLEGDSMIGTLEPGDKVIVDLRRRTPSPPGLFVVFDGLAQVAKRLEYIEGTNPPRIRVTSDNQHYLPYERTLSEVSIVGRIMGRWQRLS